MSLVVIAASELCVGDQMPEQDGFIFDVIAVDTKDNKVEVTLSSEHSSIKSHQKGVVVGYERNDAVYVLRRKA